MAESHVGGAGLYTTRAAIFSRIIGSPIGALASGAVVVAVSVLFAVAGSSEQ